MTNILGKSADDLGQPGFQHQRAGSFTRRGLSRIFRLPTKRKKEWPTCEEGIHYPVFDPRDPRHNPLAASKTWSFRVLKVYRRHGTRQATHRAEALPTLPLHRATSNLITAASKAPDPTRRPERAASDSDGTESDSSGREGAGLSESNTEEDTELGVVIHRTQGGPTREYYATRCDDIQSTATKRRVSFALPSPPRRVASSESHTSSMESSITNEVPKNEERHDILRGKPLQEKRSIIQSDNRTSEDSNSSPSEVLPEDERYDYFAENRF